MHLVRRSLRRSSQADDTASEPLYLNPNCAIAPAERIPEEFLAHGDILSGFALQGTIAWVQDHESESLLPFWLGPEFASLLQHLQPGQEISKSVDARKRWLLSTAGILTSETRQKERQEQRNKAVEKAAALFRDKGYAPVGGLIHPFHVAALRRYYRYLIRSGAIYLGDEQSSRRYVAHNEPGARFFHRQIAATLGVIAGEDLKPSYAYMASYLSGAELKKHTDREQCEFSVTLCLDFSPEPELATPWPIQLDTPSGKVRVLQGIGDGLAYRGTKLPHYRAMLGEGQSSTSIFFHYVGKDFAGSLD
jgi:hypothetical protein